MAHAEPRKNAITAIRTSACIQAGLVADRALGEVALAHKLGIKVVAEGIETHDQEMLLKEFNCDIIQGYHISHPLPPKELTAWLQATQHDK